MPEGDWNPGEGRREPLPRLESLPTAPDGYDPQAVREAFDAFYRHAAELDATLRTLEAVEAFGRQAGELRSDIRALRASSWGPVPSPRAETWAAGARRRGSAGVGGPVGDAFPRVVVETVFILLVAVGAAVAGLSTPLVIAVVVVAWLIVGAVEITASVAGPRLRRRRAAAAAARVEAPPAPTVVAPQLEAETREHAAPEPLEQEPAVADEAGAPVGGDQPHLEDELPVTAGSEEEVVDAELARAVGEPPSAEPELEPETLEPEAPEPPGVAGEPALAEPEAAFAEPEGEPLVVPGSPVEPAVAFAADVPAAGEAAPDEGADDEDTAAPLLAAPEPAGAALAAVSPAEDPWEAGPELPEVEDDGSDAAERRPRLRFWRRRRGPEEEALYPQAGSGHVHVIAVKDAAGPRAAEPGTEEVDAPPVDAWRPPAVERPPSASLRRGRR